MRQLVDTLHQWNFRVCGVFLIDSQFVVDCSKFFAGVLTALSAMIQLEIPHINVMSKMDLLTKKQLKEVDRWVKMQLDPFLCVCERHRHDNEIYFIFVSMTERLPNWMGGCSLCLWLGCACSKHEKLKRKSVGQFLICIVLKCGIQHVNHLVCAILKRHNNMQHSRSLFCAMLKHCWIKQILDKRKF